MNSYEGRIVLGSWKTCRLIGAGSYGRVYELRKADQMEEEFKAALKIISIPQDEEEYQDAIRIFGSEAAAQKYFLEMKDKLVDEIRLLYRLKGHTNIVGYQDHDIVPHDQGYGWDILIQMELLDSLHTYYEKKQHIHLQDVIKLGMDMCQALERCQRFEIVHRDIKPDNIMVSELGDYKLGDFGVSCVLGSGRTRRMSRKGTEYYMAPELIYPDRDSDSRVDIYSLGIVLYKLLNANRFPLLPDYPLEYDLIGGEDQAYIRRVRGEKLPYPLYARNTRLGEIVLKACEPDPQNRYFSPHEMYADLSALVLDQEDQVIFNVVRQGHSITYKPTDLQCRRVDVAITGTGARFRWDGQVKEAEGYTVNADEKDVIVFLKPGKQAKVRGRDPGRYPMGLTQEDFGVSSRQPGLRIGSVTVEDGWLEILPRQEAPEIRNPSGGTATQKMSPQELERSLAAFRQSAEKQQTGRPEAPAGVPPVRKGKYEAPAPAVQRAVPPKAPPAAVPVPEKKKSRTGLIVGLILGILAALIGVIMLTLGLLGILGGRETVPAESLPTVPRETAAETTAAARETIPTEEATEHIHFWREATADSPRTCAICGETEGYPLGFIPEMYGEWSQAPEAFQGSWQSPLVLEKPIEGCRKFTLRYGFTRIVQGEPFGEMVLYAQDDSMAWRQIALFEISDMEEHAFLVELESPMNIRAIAVAPREMDEQCSYNDDYRLQNIYTAIPEEN